MAEKYLFREDAPFGEDVWSKLDSVMVSAAKSRLSGRRLLDIEGPYGYSLKSVPLHDEPVADADASVMCSRSLPVPLIETRFTLGARDLATFEETGFALDTGAVAMAAQAAAAAEDRLVFEGSKNLGIPGLMTADGVGSVKMGNWQEPGAAAADVTGAIDTLDQAGFHGPYLLALTPSLYNMLYRLLPHGFRTELQHIEGILGTTVIKAPGIKKGGVLLASGRQYASIVIGQDMTIGFVGPEDSGLGFKITESLTPLIRVPGSVCVLKA